MIGNKRVACVIPARLHSSRFPKKVLAKLKGKPLLQWVWDAARKVAVFDEVGFAVDAVDTADLIESFGGKWWMTLPSCASGSDRLAQVQREKKVEADIWVNWQGDEPFICEQMITDLLSSCQEDDADLWTLRKKIVCDADLQSLHIAKVVCNAKQEALYFSRSPIPCYRDISDFSKKDVYKHVGLYAYTSRALHIIDRLPVCGIESAEQLEQLRFLYHGLKIKVHDTDYEVFGIDLPEHIHRAERFIEQNIKTW